MHKHSGISSFSKGIYCKQNDQRVNAPCLTSRKKTRMSTLNISLQKISAGAIWKEKDMEGVII